VKTQSAALAGATAPPSTTNPNMAEAIVFMIILLSFSLLMMWEPAPARKGQLTDQ
jgi:hypothetical protein